MSSRIFCLLTAVLFLMPPSVTATDFERVLVPITIQNEILGAFGSRWVTHLAITNTSATPVEIYGYDPYPSGCYLPCPPQGATPAGITFFPAPLATVTANPGSVFLVDRAHVTGIKFQLRVQDVSRQSTTWGTEVPVVRETAYASKLELLDVPLTSGFRTMLRIYDPFAGSGVEAVIRFYRTDTSIRSPLDYLDVPPARPDTLLTERSVSLVVDHRSPDGSLDLGYAEVPNVAAVPELSGVERVRIEIVSTVTGTRLWAFASVTHNDTQHVTVITPQ